MKLKLQHFGHLMQGADELEKTLMLGKMEGKREREWQRMRWLDSFTDSMDMNLSNLQETVKDTEVWHAAVHGVTKIQHNLAVKQQHQILPLFLLRLKLSQLWHGSFFNPVTYESFYHTFIIELRFTFWYGKVVPDSWRNFLLQTRNQPFLQGTLVLCSGKILCEALIWVLSLHFRVF